MNELSLFTGAGGGLLGTKLLGFRPIGYVEWEPYCQAILAQRIADGFLEEAPIFGDIREFVKSGAAREYRGFTDVVSAGFPCQPFSVAGKQKAADDERNMWPATRDVIREVRPGYALLENVPGLLATGYCETIFADLAALGFDAEWGVFSAQGSGAPHIRERLFIVAYASGIGHGGQGAAETATYNQKWHTSPFKQEGRSECGSSISGYQTLANAESQRRGETGKDCERPEEWTASGGSISDASRQGRQGRQLSCGTESEQSNSCVNRWWDVEPAVGRVADGVACRVDRLKALGNGQVPSVVARAWEVLSA